MKDTMVATEETTEGLALVVQKFTLGELTTNARSILETVRAKLASYSPERYTEENICEAKKDKAELNAAAKQLNDSRIEYEKQWMRPFEEFKGLVAEACGEIKKASSQIDALVKAVEDREKAEKRRQIEDYFSSLGFEFFTLDRIFLPAWLNKTTKMRDIQGDIQARIAKFNEDMVVLDRIGESDAKAYYLASLDLKGAMAEADRIKANREKLAAAEKAKAEAPVPTEEKPAADTIPHPAPAAIPTTLEYVLRIRGTYEQLSGLRGYMTERGIEYAKVER